MDVSAPSPVVNFARIRALAAFAAFAGGLVAGRWLDGVPSAAWFGGVCVACAVAGVSRGRVVGWALCAAVFLLGAAWFVVRIAGPVATDAAWIEAAGAMRGAPVRVRGVVVEDPVLRDPRAAFIEPAGRLVLEIEEVEGGAPARAGRLIVRAPARALRGVAAGDRLRVTGVLRGIEGPLNPGERDARMWGAQDGVRGQVVTRSTELVERLPPADGAWSRVEAWWLASRAEAKRRARAALLTDVSDEGAAGRGRAMLAALVLGVRERDAQDVHSAYVRVGLAHVMAISGFHLAVMAGFVMFAVRLTGDRGALEPILVGGLVLAYMVIVPSHAPIIRAGVMVLAVLLADALGRRYDKISVLAWIAVCLLIVRPMDLWAMGFQLSFGLVAVLMWLGPAAMSLVAGERIVTDLPQPSAWWRWPLNWVKVLVMSSVLCWAVALPVVLYHTGHVSPLAVLSTVIVLPLTIVLMWLAFAGVAAAVVAPGAVSVVGPSLGTLAEAIVWIVDGIDAMPWASFWLPRVSMWWAAGATCAGLLWFWRGRIRDRVGLGAVAAAVVWLLAEVSLGSRLPWSVALRVDVLAVGNGTCMIVRSGSGAWMWDCGSDRPGIGERLVPRAARELGAWRVPAAFVTHPNEDHYGGLPAAAAWLGTRRLYVGEVTATDAERQPWRKIGEFMSRVREFGVDVSIVGAGDEIELGGGVTMRVISPPAGATWRAINDHSLVGMIEVPTRGGVRRVLLTGDIEAQAIRHVLGAWDVRADVLELPHHGAVHDAAYEFLVRVDPHVVMQSGGIERAHDPRWFGQRSQRCWIMTAEDGAGWIEVRRDGSIWCGSYRWPKAVRVIGPVGGGAPIAPTPGRSR